MIGSPLFRIIISISLIIILLYAMRGNYEKIASTLSNIDIRMFALALVLFISAIIVASYRLSLIVLAQKEGGITLKEAISLTLLGYFFNNFLPTAIGGDVVKA